MIRPTEVELIPIDQTEDFPDHPFRVEYNKDMEALIQSVFVSGIISPLLLWEISPKRYIIISGHRRKLACEKINQTGLQVIKYLPALVYREITFDEATILMVDENEKREKLLPSEKAKAYKMKLEAMKRQGKRTDLTSSQLATKLQGQRTDLTCAPLEHKLEKTRDIIAEVSGESREQVRRYIRLTELIDPLLDMVDEDALGFRCGVELSYLDENEQELVYKEIERRKLNLALKQAMEIKAASKDGCLDREKLDEILSAQRLSNIISFRAAPDQIDHLRHASEGADTSRSKVLRAYAATGGTVYVGSDTISAMVDLQADVARVGNLLKMHQNRLDALTDNPWLMEKDRTELLSALEEGRELKLELDRLRQAMKLVCENVNTSVRKLNSGR